MDEESVKKIYVVGGNFNYASWINNYIIVDTIEEADIVLFTGGEDVDPSLYGHQKYEATYSNIDRDLKEKAIFEKMRPDQLALGICRGSQFLCVMNGGYLIQDCKNHAIWGTHSIISSENNRILDITSTHHQMQYPFNLDNEDYDLLYYSANQLSAGLYVLNNRNVKINKEPEIVLYHKKDFPMCLAIQGHPEMMNKKSITITVLNQLLQRCLR